jgi:energy-coupling factor transporter ATP-binding protein EcfA2
MSSINLTNLPKVDRLIAEDEQTMALDQANAEESSPWDHRVASLRAAEVFKPGIPINDLDFFMGRLDKIRSVTDAVIQSGQHVVIYGERGVGKTSLAKIIRPLLAEMNRREAVINVSASTKDSFSSLWTQALEATSWVEPISRAGFNTEPDHVERNMMECLAVPDAPGPTDVRKCLIQGPGLVYVFDEFDRLNHGEIDAFTDLIKGLADFDVNATLVLVGVASSIRSLIKRHESLKRNLVLIKLDRMTDDELLSILTTGATNLQMRFEPNASQRIVRLSLGLPHYTHWIGMNSVRSACDKHSQVITLSDVDHGIKITIGKAEADVAAAYDKAVHSSHGDAIYRHVLLASALAETEQSGLFSQSQVITPLSRILKKPAESATFARHLNAFTTRKRAAVLESIGEPYRRRYRFKDPLLPPYVIMKGINDGLISHQDAFPKENESLLFPTPP